MSSDTKRRPPPSVIVAVTVFLIPTALSIAVALGIVVFAIIEGQAGSVGLALLMLLMALLPGLVAQGLWRGYRGSRIMAIILGVLTLPGGLLIVALLVTRTAKEWFGVAPTTFVQFPRSD